MRLSKRLRLALGTSLLLVGALAGKAVVEQVRVTTQGYLFAYPLVLMDATRGHMMHAGLPLNHLYHMREFPDASYRAVVSPNTDTLYSLASFDLRTEPLVLHMPEMQGHYYLTPILDGWTNVVASPGSRTEEDGPHDYLIVGPSWQGQAPSGVQVLRSPTNMAWMIGRIRSRGPEDYAEIHALQDRMKLQPLSQWLDKFPPVAPHRSSRLPAIDSRPPDQQVADWSAETFFATYCQLLHDNPGRPDDAVILQRLREAGLLTDDCSLHQSPPQRFGTWLGYRMVVAALNDTDRLLEKAPTYNGWRIPYGIGSYGNDYALRALVAKIGLGANLNEDAIYPSLSRDAEGRPLTGEHRYRLHFDKSDLPPVKGFWSLTMYDQHQFFVANPLNRFAIGDRDALHYNADGSLDLYIQVQEPQSPEQKSNWLPAPPQGFNLTMRLYWPEQPVLTRAWKPPVIERLD